MYFCNRCGKCFGSCSGVIMHLRKQHFCQRVCDKCGTEVLAKGIAEHVNLVHPCIDDLPKMFKSLPSKILRPVKTVEENSFWESPGMRLSRFIAAGTSTKCRLCGKNLGGVHSREQHERDEHRFTKQTKDSLALRLRDWNILDHLDPSIVIDYVRQELKSQLLCGPECNDEINVLVNFLLDELPFRVSHVVRGGSYGKDTCIVGRSDLDMIMFIDGFLPLGGSTTLESQLRVCLNDVKEKIQSSQLATRILVTGTTERSLRFQYKCVKDDHIHHVDLMPCHDWLGPSPSLGDKQEVYEMISNSKNVTEVQLLSASLLQLQIDFVRRRPAIVRDLIRLVKKWRMTSFGGAVSLTKHRRMPNSYTLELITIRVWEKQGKPLAFQLRSGLSAVLKTLANYENLCVAWTENYSSNNHLLRKTLLGARPIVVDPANPTNNVCEGSNTWDEIAYVARTSLEKPLFKKVNHKNWN